MKRRHFRQKLNSNQKENKRGNVCKVLYIQYISRSWIKHLYSGGVYKIGLFYNFAHYNYLRCKPTWILIIEIADIIINTKYQHNI